MLGAHLERSRNLSLSTHLETETVLERSRHSIATWQYGVPLMADVVAQ